MALTSEGIRRRLRLLNLASGHFSEGINSLRTYQEEYGQDGFVHSVIELAEGTFGALSTSIGILQAFQAQSAPPSGRRQQQTVSVEQPQGTEAASDGSVFADVTSPLTTSTERF